MSTIVSVSTIVNQLSHLFEGWRSDFDNPLFQSGSLKQEYSTADFSVQICIAGEFIVRFGNDILPEVELSINRQHWLEENYDNFLAVDVLNGWCNWINGKVDDSEAFAFALDLSNQIRLALSLPPLTEFNEDEPFPFN